MEARHGVLGRVWITDRGMASKIGPVGASASSDQPERLDRPSLAEPTYAPPAG